MISRGEFAQHLAEQEGSHVDRAIAFLYYYREAQEFEERSASELAGDLHDEGFPKPHVTRLKEALTKSKYTTRGTKKGYFQLDLRRLKEISDLYEDIIAKKKIKVSTVVIPDDWVQGTRPYLEQIVYQINASYDIGLYDATSVLMRRLMESLLIEIYIHEKRHHEIQSNGTFLMLERLINYATSDSKILFSRNSPKTIKEIKQLGDTAAHDRTYVTPDVDVDDVKARYRRLIQELLGKADIKKK